MVPSAGSTVMVSLALSATAGCTGRRRGRRRPPRGRGRPLGGRRWLGPRRQHGHVGDGRRCGREPAARQEAGVSGTGGTPRRTGGMAGAGGLSGAGGGAGRGGSTGTSGTGGATGGASGSSGRGGGAGAGRGGSGGTGGTTGTGGMARERAAPRTAGTAAVVGPSGRRRSQLARSTTTTTSTTLPVTTIRGSATGRSGRWRSRPTAACSPPRATTVGSRSGIFHGHTLTASGHVISTSRQTYVAFSPDSATLVAGSNGALVTYKTSNWTLGPAFMGVTGQVRGVAVTADSQRIVTIDGDQNLYVHTLGSGGTPVISSDRRLPAQPVAPGGVERHQDLGRSASIPGGPRRSRPPARRS